MLVETGLMPHSIPFFTHGPAVDFITSKLPPEEQQEFLYLRQRIASHEAKSKKHFGLATFYEHLTTIHKFVVRGDQGDAYRGFVCGIHFGDGFLLINTTRLKKLICRSKSCVNGCFQRLGFSMGRSAARNLNDFFQQILPNLSSSLINTRQWCMRTLAEDASISFAPSSVPSSLVVGAAPEQPPEPVVEKKPFMYDITELLNRK